jgi:hypothetical protein
MIRSLSGTSIIDASPFFAVHSNYLECCVSPKRRKEANSSWCDFVIGPDDSEVIDLRSQLLNQSQHCYTSQTCQLRTEESFLLKICVNTRSSRRNNYRNKVLSLPREKGEPGAIQIQPLALT